MTRDLDENLPRTVSQAECLTCGKVWLAVHPVGCDDLVCPRCHGHDTVREDPQPAPGGWRGVMRRG